MAPTQTKSSAAAQLKQNERKWTKTVMDAGWNAFPSIIIERQAALGLDPVDINIILHLTQYWWFADNLPHPSVATIAKALRVSERTVIRRITALEKAGLMERNERRKTPYGSMTNLYSFNGLIREITPHAIEKAAEIAAATKAKADRLARKKPRLVVSNDT